VDNTFFDARPPRDHAGSRRACDVAQNFDLWLAGMSVADAAHFQLPDNQKYRFVGAFFWRRESPARSIFIGPDLVRS
jgi:hypothetical protein